MSNSEDSGEVIGKLTKVLHDDEAPLKKRFRALFALKNIDGDVAVQAICDCFDLRRSALLLHELAYCLGQMRRKNAVKKLLDLLQHFEWPVIVRHEAAEALGAIADKSAYEFLEEYSKKSPEIEVIETCQLAMKRMRWLEHHEDAVNIYGSVDPAPPSEERNARILREVLLDENEDLFERYRAMFALRDINTDETAEILAEGLETGGNLFRHEIAFVLGQIRNPITVEALGKVVADENDCDIVRHECVEALGAIGTIPCFDIIRKYEEDEKDLVRESCQIALDMIQYEMSGEFQYACV